MDENRRGRGEAEEKNVKAVNRVSGGEGGVRRKRGYCAGASRTGTAKVLVVSSLERGKNTKRKGPIEVREGSCVDNQMAKKAGTNEATKGETRVLFILFLPSAGWLALLHFDMHIACDERGMPHANPNMGVWMDGTASHRT